MKSDPLVNFFQQRQHLTRRSSEPPPLCRPCGQGMKRAADPAFEDLLRSTQALAKNIRQQHSQQQNCTVSPPILPNYQLPPQPAAPQPAPQQQYLLGASYMQPTRASFAAHMQAEQAMFASALDPQPGIRSVSLDSDMAYDTIEELLMMDNVLDDSKLAAAAAANAPPMQPRMGQGGTSGFQMRY